MPASALKLAPRFRHPWFGTRRLARKGKEHWHAGSPSCMMFSMAASTGGAATPIVLRLSAEHPRADHVTIRISPSLATELIEQLDAHGVDNGRILEFSAASDLWVQAVYGVFGTTGMAGLWAAIRTVLLRHKDKELTVSVAGNPVSLKGYSESDAEKILALLMQQQADVDTRWDRLTKGELT